MYTLKPDDKTTPVMVYMQQGVIRGEVVRQNALPTNIWLRTDGAPRYLHILKPQILVFGGGPAKALSYSEVYFPASEAIAFHTLPPAEEPLDYDPKEANRSLEPVELIVGTFVLKGKIRVSTQTGLAATLEMARVGWMSVYDVLITNPHLPQMTTFQVPMALLNPTRVAFALA